MLDKLKRFCNKIKFWKPKEPKENKEAKGINETKKLNKPKKLPLWMRVRQGVSSSPKNTLTLENISKYTPLIFSLCLVIGSIWLLSYYVMIGVYPDLTGVNLVTYIIPVTILGGSFVLLYFCIPLVCFYSLEVVDAEGEMKRRVVYLFEMSLIFIVLIIIRLCFNYQEVVCNKFLSIIAILIIIIIMFILRKYYKDIKYQVNETKLFLKNIPNKGAHYTLFVMTTIMYSFTFVVLLEGMDIFIAFVTVVFAFVIPLYILSTKYFIPKAIFVIILYSIILISVSMSPKTPVGFVNVIKAPVAKLKIGSVDADLHVYDNVSSVFVDGKSHRIEVFMLSSVGSEYIFTLGHGGRAQGNRIIYRLPKSSNIIVSYPKR